MWGRMAEWINDENEITQVPDDDAFHADVCACPYSTDLDNRITILPKDKIKKELGFSPDLGDAAALTFADKVRSLDHAPPQAVQMKTDFNVFG